MPTEVRPDPDAIRVAKAFLARIAGDYPVVEAWLYGSRARGDARPDSDVDVAVVLSGPKQRSIDVAGAWVDAEYELLLDGNLLVSAIPIWLQDWRAPERHANPWFVRNIQREGVKL